VVLSGGPAGTMNAYCGKMIMELAAVLFIWPMVRRYKKLAFI